MTLTSSLRDFARELRSRFRSMLSVRRLKARPLSSTRLELGSGPVKRAGWITLDMCLGADVYWDLRRKLPFPDSTFHHVYCSHVLEHFSYPDLCRLLLEVRRVLRPGGQFSVSVPDAAKYVDAYLGRTAGADLLRYQPAVVSGHNMDILNYIFYMDGHHRFMFDKENLAHHCRAAGFEGCAVRPFDPSLDSADRDYESLYMACYRPTTP